VLLPLGVKTLYCLGISVDPEYQRRGIGSKFIQWATKKADEDGVKVWVHASEAGWRAFAKNGFEIVETLTVDLDKYATKPRIVDGKESKWGQYNFRYMVYTPKSVVEQAR
jgi:GNAT superfamily N-acetyltransferase